MTEFTLEQRDTPAGIRWIMSSGSHLIVMGKDFDGADERYIQPVKQALRNMINPPNSAA